jgi:hypothetical protein
MEKNLIFHPKKDRSKSIPTINMNLRLKALKDMKEDLLIRRSKISEEIIPDEYAIEVPIMEYNYNDIKRSIMQEPKEELFIPVQKKLRLQPDPAENQQMNPNMNNNEMYPHDVPMYSCGNAIQEEQYSNSKINEESNS